MLRAHSLAELVRLGTMTDQCARFLEAAVVAGLNVVTAGATQAGKTTLLNCLAATIPPREWVITCEEVFELQVGLPDTVAMQTRQPNLEGEGEIRQRRLVKEALRMRPLVESTRRVWLHTARCRRIILRSRGHGS